MKTVIGFLKILLLCQISLTKEQEYKFTLAGHLPTPRYSSAAVYDGVDSVFVIGGMRGGELAYNDVLEYNITSETIQKVGNILPNVCSGAIGTDGEGNFFHTGGFSLTSRDSMIPRDRSNIMNGKAHSGANVYQFTTANPQPEFIAELSNSMSHHCAVSDFAGSIYLLGSSYRTEVLKYNTKDGTTEPAGDLVQRFQSGGCAWYSGAVYAFGGWGGAGVDYSKLILKFVPEDGTSEILEAKLPAGAMYSSAVAVGSDIYVLGGYNYNDNFVFLKFDTTTQVLEELKISNFDIEMDVSTAVYVERLNRIYIFGGSRQVVNFNYDEIYYVQL